MQIEILTRQVELKERFLTRYAKNPALWSDGHTVKIPGLEMRITSDYLLFNISSTGLAEEIIPLLFTVAPVSTAGQLYEPASDMKIIVTARCNDPADILPHMHQVTHLDLERGELLGTRLTEWHSRNVAVTARAELAVQGNILVAKIKFNTHSRDSRFNCQECVDRVSLRDILEPLCPAFAATPPEPVFHGPLLTAELTVTDQDWAELINRRPGPLTYCSRRDLFQIVFSNTGHISFHREPDRQGIMCRVEFSEPARLVNGLMDMLYELLGLEVLTLTLRAEDLLLPPDILMGELGFTKEKEFHLLTLHTGLFTACYDVRKLSLHLQRDISVPEALQDRQLIEQSFNSMLEFINGVMSRAEKGH